MKSVALVEMLQDWLGEGMIPVSRQQAQARANVCLACPMNENGRVDEFFKGAVASFIRRQVEIKNDMKLRVEGEKKLHICSACYCILRLKTWVPIKHLAEITDDETLKKFHSSCWIPKELDAYTEQCLTQNA